MNDIELIEEALKARENSYSPYSHFAVGAALLAENGTVYRGCNIENSSYGATNCAERTAIFKAISEGVKEFNTIAIAGGIDTDETPEGYAYPCGICRQVMREFCNPKSFRIIVCRSTTDYKVYTLEEMLPFDFGPENLY